MDSRGIAPSKALRPSGNREMGAPTRMQTTLYDLIAALQDVMAPEEEELMIATVVYFLNTGHITFAADSADLTELDPAAFSH